MEWKLCFQSCSRATKTRKSQVMPATVPVKRMNPWCPVSWSPQNKQPRTGCSTKDATKSQACSQLSLLLKQQRQQKLVLSHLLSRVHVRAPDWPNLNHVQSLAARESRTHTFYLSSPHIIAMYTHIMRMWWILIANPPIWKSRFIISWDI